MSSIHITQFASYRTRFASWRHDRPFWGALLVILAGLVIGIIPAQLAITFALVPSTFMFAGLVFAVFVFLSGVFALLRPEFAEFFGAAGILLSIASIFGALGGFGVGMILGTLGGALCVAWEPPETTETDTEETTPAV
ncbi:DUF6114 domain-containing protein [Haladaptatus sp.]|uniref:DUF6114 domain-containing protein n=1 Tax=Haladaptatus sp. TaxID=1973141 RepID=UPI003C605F7B